MIDSIINYPGELKGCFSDIWEKGFSDEGTKHKVITVALKAFAFFFLTVAASSIGEAFLVGKITVVTGMWIIGFLSVSKVLSMAEGVKKSKLSLEKKLQWQIEKMRV